MIFCKLLTFGVVLSSRLYASVTSKYNRYLCNVILYTYFTFYNLNLGGEWKISDVENYWDNNDQSILAKESSLGNSSKIFLYQQIVFYGVELLLLIKNRKKIGNYYLFFFHHFSAISLVSMVLYAEIPYPYALNVLLNHDFTDILINLVCLFKTQNCFKLLELNVLLITIFWAWCRFYNMYFLLDHISVNDGLLYGNMELVLMFVKKLLQFHIFANILWYLELLNGIKDEIFTSNPRLPSV